jgi:peptide/nickel transport system substrate-binding protein
MYQIWSAANIPDLNAGAYRNPEVEALFEQGAVEFDRGARRAIYARIQRLLAEDQPYIFLFENKAVTGIHERIAGIRPSPLGLDWNLEDWHVR